jgi:hypothetical protein
MTPLPAWFTPAAAEEGRQSGRAPGMTPAVSPDPRSEIAGARHSLHGHRGPQKAQDGDTPSRTMSFSLGRAESVFPGIGDQHRADADGVANFFEVV